MTLGELIKSLSEEDQTLVLPVGFGKASSYRGLYERLSFEPALDVSIASMLESAKGAVGKTFVGYKGGDYEMAESTDVYFSFHDVSSGVEITDDFLEVLVSLGRQKRIDASNPKSLQADEKPDIWRGLMQACDEVVERKGRDYTKGSSDRLANFREAGSEAGIAPLQAWVVFFNKHIAAIKNYIKTGGQSESEPIMGRFVDAINYLRLGWLLVLDAQYKAQEKAPSAVSMPMNEGPRRTMSGEKLNYKMGAGRYQEAPGVSLTGSEQIRRGDDTVVTGRKFELFGRGAMSAVIYYDDEDKAQAGWSVGITWLGEEIRVGRVFPIDGTPE